MVKIKRAKTSNEWKTHVPGFGTDKLVGTYNKNAEFEKPFRTFTEERKKKTV